MEPNVLSVGFWYEAHRPPGGAGVHFSPDFLLWSCSEHVVASRIVVLENMAVFYAFCPRKRQGFSRYRPQHF